LRLIAGGEARDAWQSQGYLAYRTNLYGALGTISRVPALTFTIKNILSSLSAVMMNQYSGELWGSEACLLKHRLYVLALPFYDSS
jgi:hypothetical protein